MPTESLLLNIPEGMPESVVLERLAEAGYRTYSSASENLEILYVDTQGGALFRTGIRLRHLQPRPRWQWWRDGVLLEEEGGFPQRPPLPPTGKISAGRAVAPARLLPLLRLKIAKRNFRLKEPEGSPLRLSFLRLRCSRPHRTGMAEGPRLVQVPLQGTDPRMVEKLRVFLTGWAGLTVYGKDLLEIGLERLELPLPGAPVPAHLLLAPFDTIQEALRKILGRQAFKIRANLEGAVLDLDPEFVHDIRVATRRARFALRLFRDVVGRDQARELRERLRWLTGACAPVRDLDVLLAALREHPALGQTPLGMDGIVRLLTPLREQARSAMIAVLQSEDFPSLLRQIEEIHARPAPEAAVGETISTIGPRWMRRSLNQVRKENLAVGSGEREPEGRDLHRLRIAFKGVRYTCEFFRELVPREELDPVLGLLVGYQDCLGKFQDAQVALSMLDKITRDRWQAASPALDEALSLGAAMHVFREQAARSRSDFLARWPSFEKDMKDFRAFLRGMIEESASPQEDHPTTGNEG